MTALFDTLKYTKGAEAIGIKREHAEYQAQEIAKLIDDTLATKIDLKDLELRMVIKMGAIMGAYTMIIIAAVGFILKH